MCIIWYFGIIFRMPRKVFKSKNCISFASACSSQIDQYLKISNTTDNYGLTGLSNEFKYFPLITRVANFPLQSHLPVIIQTLNLKIILSYSYLIIRVPDTIIISFRRSFPNIFTKNTPTHFFLCLSVAC
jgi:hypothetical protein